MRTLTPVDKIDRDLRAARQLRFHVRSPEQDAKLMERINQLLDERNALTCASH